MMAIRAEIGDVFKVPLNESSFGIGVVASKRGKELYLVFFENRFSVGEKVGDIRLLNPCIVSSSLDAKIWHAHWPIIKKKADVLWILQPTYKVQEVDGWVAESFDGKQRRSIDPIEADKLRFRKCVAPIRLENALKAYFDILIWDSTYEELLYSNLKSLKGSKKGSRINREKVPVP